MILFQPYSDPPPPQRYMATHPKHYIIELDGNLSPDDMFKVSRTVTL